MLFLRPLFNHIFTTYTFTPQISSVSIVNVESESQKFSGYLFVCRKKMGDNSNAAIIGDAKRAVFSSFLVYIFKNDIDQAFLIFDWLFPLFILPTISVCTTYLQYSLKSLTYARILANI